MLQSCSTSSVRSLYEVCEEAGEIMEPHMLLSLLPSVEHVILIGDHQQLRPRINNHSLSMESQQEVPYQLDRSLFERLLVGESRRPPFPVTQLNIQRRIHLEDRSRGVIDQGSYTNRWEVEMTHVLLRHNIRQREYCSNDIAVLTPHTGQLQKLRSRF